MYIPVDPKKISSLWENFGKSLQIADHAVIVSAGILTANSVAHRMSQADANDLIARMNGLPYVRVGTAKMNAVPPHFGVCVDASGNKAILMEFIVLEHSPERLHRDLHFIIDFIFFEIPALQDFVIPFCFEGVAIPGLTFFADFENKQTRVHRA